MGTRPSSGRENGAIRAEAGGSKTSKYHLCALVISATHTDFHPKAAMQARAQGQAAQMAGTPGVPQATPAPNHAAANNAVNGVNRANIPNQLAAAAAAAAAANQARPR